MCLFVFVGQPGLNFCSTKHCRKQKYPAKNAGYFIFKRLLLFDFFKFSINEFAEGFYTWLATGLVHQLV